MFKNFLGSISRNLTSLIGTALALSSLILIVSLFVIQQLGYEGDPYLGILTFLILPMLCILGLLMIPVGNLLWRRKVRKTPAGESTPALPVFDLNSAKTRKWLLVFISITTVNVVVLASATYKGIHIMESHRILWAGVPLCNGARAYGARTRRAFASFLCGLSYWARR